MTAKKEKKQRSIEVDWDKVEYLLQSGCTGSQVCAALGFSQEILYKRCLKEQGMSFIDYRTEKRKKGHSNILMKQFAKAMKGDNTMLVWVGKQQLGQRDEVKTTHQFDGKLGALLDHLKNVKSEDDFESGEGKEDAIQPQDD